VTEFARQLTANDDVIFVYALFHSNAIFEVRIFTTVTVSKCKTHST